MLPIAALSLIIGILLAEGGFPPAAILGVLSAPWIGKRAFIINYGPFFRAAFVASLFVAIGSSSIFLRVSAADRVAELLPPDRSPLRTECVAWFDGVLVPGMSETIRRGACLVDEAWVPMGFRVFTGNHGSGAARSPLLLRGRLAKPSGTSNPYDAPPSSRSRRQGTGAWLFLTSAPESSGNVTDTALLPNLRETIARRVAGPSRGHALVGAMLLGKRDHLSMETTTEFRTTGTAHLLAVSGLHTGVFIGIGILIIGWLVSLAGLSPLWRRITSFMVVMAMLVFIIQLIGMRSSIIRAAAMAAILLLRRTWLRSGSRAVDTLALLIVALLGVEPAWLHDAGFLLSVSAVSTLLLIPVDGGVVRRSIAVSLLVTVCTAPFVAGFFGSIPLGGILLNVIAIPVTALIVSSGVISLVPVPGASIFLDAALFWANTLLALVHAAAGPAATFLLSSSIVPLAVGGVATLYYGMGNGRRAVFVASVVLLSVGFAESVPMKTPLEVTFLATGQGDAAVIRTPSGRTVVVDTGPGYSPALVRFLERTAVQRIDLLILSHDHADHTGGFDAVESRWPIGRVLLPPGFDATRLTGSDRSTLAIRRVSAGDTVHVDSAVHVTVLSPFAGASGTNDQSIVFRLTYGGRSFLFTGDAERDAESRMVINWPDFLSADVVKVAHHGSRTSSTPYFVGRTGAEHAIVSVGRNGYSLPNEEILTRWRTSHADVHITGDNGAFCLRTDGSSIDTGCR